MTSPLRTQSLSERLQQETKLRRERGLGISHLSKEERRERREYFRDSFAYEAQLRMIAQEYL